MAQDRRLWEVGLDRKHYYFTRPENCHQKVLVGIYADKVDILCNDGIVSVSHERRFRPERTDSNDYRTTLCPPSEESRCLGEQWHPPAGPRTPAELSGPAGLERPQETASHTAELTSRYSLETMLTATEPVLKPAEARRKGTLEKLVKELQKQDLPDSR